VAAVAFRYLALLVVLVVERLVPMVERLAVATEPHLITAHLRA
jgi:hypothetical protein